MLKRVATKRNKLETKEDAAAHHTPDHIRREGLISGAETSLKFNF